MKTGKTSPSGSTLGTPYVLSQDHLGRGSCQADLLSSAYVATCRSLSATYSRATTLHARRRGPTPLFAVLGRPLAPQAVARAPRR